MLHLSLSRKVQYTSTTSASSLLLFIFNSFEDHMELDDNLGEQFEIDHQLQKAQSESNDQENESLVFENDEPSEGENESLEDATERDQIDTSKSTLRASSEENDHKNDISK